MLYFLIANVPAEKRAIISLADNHDVRETPAQWVTAGEKCYRTLNGLRYRSVAEQIKIEDHNLFNGMWLHLDKMAAGYPHGHQHLDMNLSDNPHCGILQSNCNFHSLI